MTLDSRCYDFRSRLTRSVTRPNVFTATKRASLQCKYVTELVKICSFTHATNNLAGIGQIKLETFVETKLTS